MVKGLFLGPLPRATQLDLRNGPSFLNMSEEQVPLSKETNDEHLSEKLYGDLES